MCCTEKCEDVNCFLATFAAKSVSTVVATVCTGELADTAAKALSRVVFDGGGDMSPSLDFGVPLTGIDSTIPRWDAFNPPHWNEFCPSVSNKLLTRPSTTMLLF